MTIFLRDIVEDTGGCYDSYERHPAECLEEGAPARLVWPFWPWLITGAGGGVLAATSGRGTCEVGSFVDVADKCLQKPRKFKKAQTVAYWRADCLYLACIVESC